MPHDAPFADFVNHAKAHRIVLRNPRPIPDDVYLAAVRCEGWKGWETRFIPKDRRTKELCAAALEQDVDAIQYFPEPACSDALYLSAVRRGSVPCEGSSTDTLPRDGKGIGGRESRPSVRRGYPRNGR